MGTPVSKSTNNSVSERDYVPTEDGDNNGTFVETNTGIDSAENNEHGSATTTIPRPLGQETEMIQSLCEADDDDIGEKEWTDIYSRLKTNKNEDLHILNTRFNNKDLPVQSIAKHSSSGADPLLTSTFAERSTRINSANFNPHAIEIEREKTRIRTAKFRKAGIEEDSESEEDNKADNSQTNEIQNEPGDTLNCTEKQPISETENHNLLEKINSSVESKCKHNSQGLANPNEPGENQLLNLPEKDRVSLSPVPSPRSRGNSIIEDPDLDPLEGLAIPRERVVSIGSASIYSVKEISDELYLQYMAEIKSCIRSYGFFEAFPSPSIVGESQKIYRKLDMPSPVDDEGNVLPHPPKVTKKDYITSDTEAFNAVRDKINKMPSALQKNAPMVDIVNYLCEALDNDTSKLRMLAAWIVHQQQTAEPKAPNRDTWVKRFRALCKFARIKVRTIKGIIRDSTYVPGEDTEKHRGIWLAVLVNHTWLLVDPAVDKDNGPNSTSSGNANHNPDLFEQVETIFQDPEHFIFSHFPDDEHWQLLARPVTREELASLAVVRQCFFDLGLNLLNHWKSAIVTETSETNISVSFPEDLKPKFKCNLHICDNSISDKRMRTYVFLETLLNEQTVNLRVRLPKKCSYILDLFVSAENTDWQNVLTTRLEYGGSEGSSPFPVNPREEWGPGLDTELFGIIPKTHHGGQIVIQKGVIQIVFKDQRKLSFNHDIFREDLKIDPNCLKVSMLRDKNNDVIFVVDIDIRVQGVFTLQLLTRADSRCDFQNFCTYLIKKEKAALIPRLEFNTSKDADEKSVVKVPDNGKLQLVVDATGLIQLSVELKHHDRQELNFSEHTRHWIVNDQGFIDINCPRKGKYTVQVLGRTVLKGRFKTLIEETLIADIPSERWSCFPKMGSHWNSWYKIDAPLSHHLEEKEDVEFIVDIKNALDVAVLAAKGWYHLEKGKDDWVWTGQVYTGPKSTMCQLLARFEVGSEKWSDLLWFKVMAEDDFESLEERQHCSIENAQRELKNLKD